MFKPAEGQVSTPKASPTFNDTKTTYASAFHSPASPERKYNVIVFGLNEAAAGTPRSRRVDHDLGSISSVFREVDTSLDSTVVRSHFRLGKFNRQATKPRPVLVKQTRMSVVNTFLSKHGDLQPPVSIRADVSPSERARNSALLKERWSIIQSGIDKKRIKIAGNSIFVDKKLHAKYSEGSLTRSADTIIATSESVPIPEETNVSLSLMESPDRGGHSHTPVDACNRIGEEPSQELPRCS